MVGGGEGVAVEIDGGERQHEKVAVGEGAGEPLRVAIPHDAGGPGGVVQANGTGGNRVDEADFRRGIPSIDITHCIGVGQGLRGRVLVRPRVFDDIADGGKSEARPRVPFRDVCR